MADFGIDPSILLARTQSSGEPIGAAFERMIRMQAQRQQMQQMQYEQQRQRGFSQLVAQNAGAYQDPAARAYALGGYGEQAAQAQQAAMMRQHAISQQQQQQQEMQESAAKIEGIHRNLTASRLATAKTQEDFDRIASTVPEEYGLKPGSADWPEQVKSFRQALITPEQEAQNKAVRLRIAAMRGSQPVVRTNALGQVIAVDPDTNEAVIVDANKKPVRPAGGAGAGAAPASANPKDDAFVEGAAQDVARGLPITSIGLSRTKDAATLKRIAARAYEIKGGEGIGLAQATRSADAKSLGHQQQQSDTVNSFTRTFDKNLGILEESLGRLNSSSSPFANKGLRYLQKNATGNPDYTAFTNALNTVRSELGKINSGSTGAGGVPISVLAEMEHGLPEDATPAQFMAAIKVYRKDSENRREAMQEQIDETRTRMSGKKPVSAAEAASPGLPPTMDPAKVSARIAALIKSGVKDRESIKKALRAEGLAP